MERLVLKATPEQMRRMLTTLGSSLSREPLQVVSGNGKIPKNALRVKTGDKE